MLNADDPLLTLWRALALCLAPDKRWQAANWARADIMEA